MFKRVLGSSLVLGCLFLPSVESQAARPRAYAVALECQGPAIKTIVATVTFKDGHEEELTNSCKDGAAAHPWPEEGITGRTVRHIRTTIVVDDGVNPPNTCRAFTGNGWLKTNCFGNVLPDEIHLELLF